MTATNAVYAVYYVRVWKSRWVVKTELIWHQKKRLWNVHTYLKQFADITTCQYQESVLHSVALVSID